MKDQWILRILIVTKASELKIIEKLSQKKTLKIDEGSFEEEISRLYKLRWIE